MPELPVHALIALEAITTVSIVSHEKPDLIYACCVYTIVLFNNRACKRISNYLKRSSFTME